MPGLAVVQLAADIPAGTAGPAEGSTDLTTYVVWGLVAVVLFLGWKLYRRPHRAAAEETVFVPPQYMVHMGDDAITWVRAVRAEVVAIMQGNDRMAETLEEACQRLTSLQGQVEGDVARALADVERRVYAAGAGSEKLSLRLDKVVGELGAEVRQGRRRGR